jgi:hypothetical protein
LSLELRSATALAQLWSSQGNFTGAADLLEDIYRQFTEGHQTVDLRRAGQVLAMFEQQGARPESANRA